MFSSNQKLVISGEMSQLRQAMEFAIKEPFYGIVSFQKFVNYYE